MRKIDRAESRAEKDAKKDAEKGANKRARGGGGEYGNKRRRIQYQDPSWNEFPGPSSSYYYGNRREQWGPPPLAMVPQRPYKPKVLGPCFQCGGYGHIAKFCNVPKKPYPFTQPVVSSAGVCRSAVRSAGHSLCCQSVDSSVVSSSVCVDEVKLVVKECVDGQFDEHRNSMWDSQVTLEITQFWELESLGAVQIADVQGRLKQCLPFWRDVLQAPPNILECIENGYRLPIKFIPPTFCQSNHDSASAHQEFVDEAVHNLVQNRCVVKTDKQPHICSPLSVVSNAVGKLRLVLNLRYLNKFLHLLTFKYEDLRVAALLFDKDEYLFKFDLKSGYHHVDIHPECYEFLGFQWDDNFYSFTVLPFGLSSACYLFTKLLRPLIRLWRGRGLKAIIYLDDGIVAVKGKERAIRESALVKSDLEHAGFVVNIQKSQWEPSHVVEWLGLIIDLSKGVFTVPDHKIDRLRCKLAELNSTDLATARQIASVAGTIMSMSLALGSVSRLMTRSMYAVINSRKSWCQKLGLTKEAQDEVEFWLARISEFNGQDIWQKPSALRLVYSDASSTGFGGYTVEHGNLVANGQWSAEEAVQSSTWWELRAVKLVLKSFQGKLANERVRWFTDNQNVVRIVQNGSPKDVLQAEALDIFFCVCYQ